MLDHAKKLKLRRQAHVLNPVVLLGQHGYTPAVHTEIDRALHDHELIKIKIPIEDREHRSAVMQQICQELRAELIQSIGKTLVIYRKRPA